MTYLSSSTAETFPTQPPLAVVGISALFPKASNAEEFWSNIRRGIDAITEIPATHWNPDDYFDANPKSPDMTYARRGGFLSPLPFDPLEFGISPNNLEAIDTSQLLGMVGAKRALEHAGYGAGREFDRSRVGCILGVTGTLEMVIPLGARLGHPRWRQALKDAGVADDVAADVVNRISESYVPWQENSFPGLLGNVVAGRIANRLDLHGTNCVVDAACASSLSAIHLAALELWTGRSDMVVTGGIDTFNDIFMFMCFSKTPALSPTGDAKPFSDEADGTILGEGVGMLVLKRQVDAERDGDRIYAILKGIGTSSDGAGNAVYAPKAEGQIRCLQDAYRVAGVSPDTIELVEAHGTGTKVGDATEVSGLMQVYQATGRRGPWCAVGSIKSQIGHTKAAAGSAGVIKAILALQHRVLPPTIKVQRPPAAMLAEDSPFYVNTEPRPWVRSPQHPRRAAVSAFGFGGSNFHCVLEESPQHFEEPDWDGEVQVVALSATTAGGLIEPLTERVRSLATADWNELCLFATKCRSDFRVHHAHRLLLVIERGKTDLLNLVTSSVTMLQQYPNKTIWSTPDGAFYGEGRPAGKLGVLFPGQGSQYVGMFRELTCRFPVMLDVLVEANEVFAESVDQTATDRLSDYIYPQPSFTAERRIQQENNLRATQIAQPAIGATSLATLALLGEFGVEPEAAAGHSYGELTALCASRRFAPRVLYRLSMLRGQLMAAAQQVEGGMLALGAPLTQIEAALKELSVDLVVANHNSPTQVVLSGRIPEIDRASELFASRNIRGKKLAVAAAFHSPMVAPASRAFRPVLDEVEFAPSQMPVYANSTATEYPADPAAARDLLATQLARPVNFVSEIEQMHADGVRTFLEVGPASVLTSLVNSILSGRDYRAIAVDSSSGKRGGMFDLALALAQLSALGHAVRWEQWDPQRGRASEPVDSRRLRIPICGANYVKARPPIPPRPAISPLTIGAGLAVSPPSVSPPSVTVPSVTVPSVTVPAISPRAGSPLGAATQAAVVNKFVVGKSVASEPVTAPAMKLVPEPTRVGVASSVAPPTPVVTQHRQVASSALVSLVKVSPPREAVLPATGPTIPIPQVASESLQQIAMARTTDTETRTAIRQTLMSLQRMQEETTRLHQQFLEGQAAAFKTFERLACQRLGDDFEVDAKIAVPPAIVPIGEVSLAGLTPMQATTLPQPAPSSPPESLPVRASVSFQSLVNPAGNRSRTVADQALKTATPTSVDAEPVVPQKTPHPALALPSMLPPAGLRQPAVVPQPATSIPPSPHVEKVQETGFTERLLSDEPVAQHNRGQSSSIVAAEARHSLGATVLSVVSEKTGYPTEMLNLDMSLDHDLGIDSIKRVEILSALQERVPNLPAFQPDELGALHTLRDVVTLADARAVKTASLSPSQPAKLAASQLANPNHFAPVAVVSQPVANRFPSADAGESQLAPIVLAVVSEKTGYPTEMLNLDMSLDHDLGIDSIKRVEILSALQERVPKLPVFQPDELGALHTLRDVVTLAEARSVKTASASPSQPAQPAVAQAPVPNQAAPTSSVPSAASSVPSAVANQSMGTGLSTVDAGESQLAPIVLAVVSEKTGYPTEMLNLDMSLDHDLGIDSIKRVEILSALQERVPNLPAFQPEELGALHTLRDVVSLADARAVKTVSASPSQPANPAFTPASVSSRAAPTSSAPTAVASQQFATGLPSADAGESQLAPIVLAVVSEKTGYPTEMLNLDMSLDHDLGIDSIKRVEILSALQERVPNLPAFQPEELGALHTLRDVVTLADARSAESVSASSSQPAKPAAPQLAIPNRAAPVAVASQPVATGLASAYAGESQLAPIVLAVVAEKTGYPTEMLNLDMSLDHDLGIDSIKRVEILSALQERVPNLPPFQPEELGALHTLRDVVALADARIPGSSRGTKPQAGDSIPATATPSTRATAPSETRTEIRSQSTALPVTGGSVAHASPGRSAVQRSLVYPVPLAVGATRQSIPFVAGGEIWITEDHSDLSLWIAHELQQRGLQPRIVPLEGPVPTELPPRLVGLIVVTPPLGISESQLWDAVRWLQGVGPALRRATPASPTLFATLARLDGRFGFESNHVLHDPISGGLAGVAKCAALEWPEVHSRAIDISPDWPSNQALATRLVAELLDEGPVEVGVTPQGCYALETQEMPPNRPLQDRPVSPGDLIVISGGARGVTAEAAFAIAQAWQPRLAILGRSPEPAPEPEWLARLTNEGDLRQGLISRAAAGTTPKAIAAETQRILSGREIAKQLHRLRSLGTSVTYHAVDVRDPAVVGPLLRQLQHQWGPVRGIIHGAGVLADQKIEDKTKEQFDRVYQTKIHGLASILNHVDPQELRLLGLFSSYTARFGRIGQLDYAIANEVMNKLARQFSLHYPQCRVASFNWGPWDGGMVQGGLKKLFAAEGVGLIPLEAGADLLVSEFEQTDRQSVEILVLAPHRDSSTGTVTSGAAIRPRTASAAVNSSLPASPPSVDAEVTTSATSSPAFRLASPVTSDRRDDLKVALELDLDVAKYPFLESHVIGGKAVLPVAMILEWMAHAAIHLNPGLELQGFDEFRVYQGIRLGADDRVRLKVLLGKTIRTEARFTARVQLVVQAHGREVLHAGGQVVLSAGYPVVPSPMLATRGEQYSLNLTAAYDQRLFHGPMFQGLLSIDSCSAAGIVVTAGAATAPGNWMSEPTRGTWLADPLAIDVALQAVILWSQEMRGQPCLPCAISSYRQYRPVFPQTGVRIVISLREGSHQLIRCDIDFVDQHERLVARIEGCESVADAALVAAFQRNQLEVPTV